MDYKKYYPKLSLKLQAWSWLQYVLVFCFMMYFINNLYRLSFSDAIIYAIFLYVSIYGLTSLMDKEPHAWLFEIIKSSIGFLLILVYGDWFFLSTYSNNAIIFIQIYFLISTLIVLYFSFLEKKIQPIKF